MLASRAQQDHTRTKAGCFLALVLLAPQEPPYENEVDLTRGASNCFHTSSSGGIAPEVGIQSWKSPKLRLSRDSWSLQGGVNGSLEGGWSLYCI